VGKNEGIRARKSSPFDRGPDLLARYLSAYVQAHRSGEVVRPWGLGEEGLEEIWERLAGVLNSNARRLNRVIAEELSEADRARIAESLVPLIFALPLRSYPAELRAMRNGSDLILRLRHLGGHSVPVKPAGSSGPVDSIPELLGKSGVKGEEVPDTECVGHLPAALTPALAAYLRRVLNCDEDQRCETVVSSGGRRRRVRVTFLAHGHGIVVRFQARIDSPACDTW
jgi:hypothetical protein